MPPTSTVSSKKAVAPRCGGIAPVCASHQSRILESAYKPKNRKEERLEPGLASPWYRVRKKRRVQRSQRRQSRFPLSESRRDFRVRANQLTKAIALSLARLAPLLKETKRKLTSVKLWRWTRDGRQETA